MGDIAQRLSAKAQAAPTDATFGADEVRPYTPPPSWMDPRPDLGADSKLWQELFTLAAERSEEFCEVLRGFRAGGTRLRPGKTVWILRPDIETTGRFAWSSQAEYDEMKEKFLQPWIGTLGDVLKQLTQRYPLPKG
jgi:hypothetical protein